MKKKLNVVLLQKKKPRLHAIMERLFGHQISGVIKTIRKLKASGKYDEEGHHVFLFPEDYVNSFYKVNHSKTKKKIKKIQAELPDNWALAFNYNELIGKIPGLLNPSRQKTSSTGYLITREGHTAFPKREFTQLEGMKAKKERKNLEKEYYSWKKRKNRIRDWSPASVAFGGHEIEHWVCGDVRIANKFKNSIALVSARDLNAEHWYSERIGINKFHELRPIIIVNDPEAGSAAIINGKQFDVYYAKGLEKANEALKHENIEIKIHK